MLIPGWFGELIIAGISRRSGNNKMDRRRIPFKGSSYFRAISVSSISICSVAGF